MRGLGTWIRWAHGQGVDHVGDVDRPVILAVLARCQDELRYAEKRRPTRRSRQSAQTLAINAECTDGRLGR